MNAQSIPLARDLKSDLLTENIRAKIANPERSADFDLQTPPR